MKEYNLNHSGLEILYLLHAFGNEQLDDLLSKVEEDLRVLGCCICDLFFFLGQPLLQHQTYAIFSDGVELVLAEICDLAVSHFHRHWVCDKAAEVTAPLNDLGYRRSEDLIQLLVLFCLLLVLTPYRSALQTRMAMIA